MRDPTSKNKVEGDEGEYMILITSSSYGHTHMHAHTYVYIQVHRHICEHILIADFGEGMSLRET